MKSSVRTVIVDFDGAEAWRLAESLRKQNKDVEIMVLSNVEATFSDFNGEWRKCDLFSIESVERALPSGPREILIVNIDGVLTSGLDQGDWSDFNFLIIDNLRRVSGRDIKAVPRISNQSVAFQLSKTARSIQKLPWPRGETALSVGDEYFRWLGQAFAPLIRTSFSRLGLVIEIQASLGSSILLQLDRTHPQRHSGIVEYLVKGGVLSAGTHGGGRLEFREWPEEESILVALHDFTPALPWSIYKLTQANLHVLTVKLFARHLNKYA